MANKLQPLGNRAIVAAAGHIGQTESGLYLAREMGQPVYYVVAVGARFGAGARVRRSEARALKAAAKGAENARKLASDALALGASVDAQSIKPGDQLLVQRDLGVEFSYQPYSSEELSAMDSDDPRHDPMMVTAITEDEILAVIRPDVGA